MNEIQLHLVAEEAKRDFNAAMQAVRGDADQHMFTDQFMHTYLDNAAKQDQRLTNAWLNRKADPRTYRDAVEKLGRRFRNEVVAQAIDRGATEDREAVTAAVRGSSGRVPEGPAAPDYSRMSDADFAKEKDRVLGR